MICVFSLVPNQKSYCFYSVSVVGWVCVWASAPRSRRVAEAESVSRSLAIIKVRPSPIMAEPASAETIVIHTFSYTYLHYNYQSIVTTTNIITYHNYVPPTFFTYLLLLNRKHCLLLLLLVPALPLSLLLLRTQKFAPSINKTSPLIITLRYVHPFLFITSS